MINCDQLIGVCCWGCLSRTISAPRHSSGPIRSIIVWFTLARARSDARPGDTRPDSYTWPPTGRSQAGVSPVREPVTLGQTGPLGLRQAALRQTSLTDDRASELANVSLTDDSGTLSWESMPALSYGLAGSEGGTFCCGEFCACSLTPFG